MPIIQGRDEKYPYKGYRYYLQAFRLKAVVSKWLRRCTKEGFLVWKTRRRRFESWHGLFFFFFSFFLSLFFFFFLFVYVWKCYEWFVHFLHIVAKSPSAFPK